MSRWRVLFVLSALSLLTTSGVWLWSRFIWPEAVSICFGLQRNPAWHPIVGLHDNHHGGWYQDTIIPWPPWDPFSQSHHIHSHRLSSFYDFQYIGYFATGEDWYYAVGFPFWFVALVSAGLLGWSTRRLRTRPREGFCAKCGYDLRASHGRCPECGTPIEPQARS